MSLVSQLCVYLGSIIVHLDGVVEYPDGQIKELTGTEHKLFLRLLERNLTAPYGYLTADFLARSILPDYYDMEMPEQTIRQHILKLRQKLRETSEPIYLVNYPGKGYKLFIPEGCCFISIQEVRQQLEMLTRS